MATDESIVRCAECGTYTSPSALCVECGCDPAPAQAAEAAAPAAPAIDSIPTPGQMACRGAGNVLIGKPAGLPGRPEGGPHTATRAWHWYRAEIRRLAARWCDAPIEIHVEDECTMLESCGECAACAAVELLLTGGA